MKRSVSLFAMVAAVMLWSCGGNAGKKESAAKGETKTEVKKEKKVKKEPSITLKINGEEVPITETSMLNGGTTPADVNYEWSISGYKEGDSGSFIGVEFEAKDPASLKGASCTIDGYKVLEFDLKLDEFVTGKRKNSYGVPLGIGCKSMKGTFTGKAQKIDKNLQPVGDPVEFSGTLQK
jgi:hypothetical protein